MERQRLAWCDAVRLLAFFLLFACHATDPINAGATYGASSAVPISQQLTEWGAWWGAMARPCVPLFVMLTGALTLPVRLPMEQFYRHRIPRVLFPFLIWSAAYYLTPWLTGLMGMDRNVVHSLFPWAESDSQTLADGLDKVARIPYTFSFIACHMWYIYMLIGLYLYQPIFSAWVERATKRQKEIVLAIWALSTLLPYFSEFVSRYAFGTCEWNSFGLFYYFAGFNGYLLLGHYIRHHVRLGACATWAAALPMLVAGFAVTLYGFKYIMSLPDKTPEQIEMFWTYNTPNVAMMSAALFLIVGRTRINDGSRAATALANLTTCGFGMYMIHYYFVRLGFDAAMAAHVPAPLVVPVSALVILACSWTMVAAAKRLMGQRSKWLLG